MQIHGCKVQQESKSRPDNTDLEVASVLILSAVSLYKWLSWSLVATMIWCLAQQYHNKKPLTNLLWRLIVKISHVYTSELDDFLNKNWALGKGILFTPTLHSKSGITALESSYSHQAYAFKTCRGVYKCWGSSQNGTVCFIAHNSLHCPWPLFIKFKNGITVRNCLYNASLHFPVKLWSLTLLTPGGIHLSSI